MGYVRAYDTSRQCVGSPLGTHYLIKSCPIRPNFFFIVLNLNFSPFSEVTRKDICVFMKYGLFYQIKIHIKIFKLSIISGLIAGLNCVRRVKIGDVWSDVLELFCGSIVAAATLLNCRIRQRISFTYYQRCFNYGCLIQTFISRCKHKKF